MRERQEIHCHACGRYVQFDIDIDLDGNHMLECPNCGHEHCRVVKNGVITGERWDSRTGVTIMATSVTSSTLSYELTFFTATTTSSAFTAGSWLQTTSGTTG